MTFRPDETMRKTLSKSRDGSSTRRVSYLIGAVAIWCDEVETGKRHWGSSSRYHEYFIPFCTIYKSLFWEQALVWAHIYHLKFRMEGWYLCLISWFDGSIIPTWGTHLVSLSYMFSPSKSLGTNWELVFQ